jgi:hypothetical protein
MVVTFSSCPFTRKIEFTRRMSNRRRTTTSPSETGHTARVEVITTATRTSRNTGTWTDTRGDTDTETCMPVASAGRATRTKVFIVPVSVP